MLVATRHVEINVLIVVFGLAIAVAIQHFGTHGEVVVADAQRPQLADTALGIERVVVLVALVGVDAHVVDQRDQQLRVIGRGGLAAHPPRVFGQR